MELKTIELKKLLASGDIGLRQSRDEKLFNELKESIRVKGLIFPLVAAKSGDSHRLIDGALRLAALTELGWDKDKRIPVILIEAKGGEAVEAALIANAVRENINSAGLAEAVNLLVNEYGRKPEDVAAALGKTKSYVYRLLRIYGLPEYALAELRKGKISTAHCYGWRN